MRVTPHGPARALRLYFPDCWDGRSGRTAGWFVRPLTPVFLMNTISSLTGAHLHTYTILSQHPVSHNLLWHEIHGLLRHLGVVHEQSNGSLRVTRNGHTYVLHPAHTKEAPTTAELIDLRHFLERSETVAIEAPDGGAHLLLVIDHHEARIFHTEINGGVPERLQARHPSGHFRHAAGSKDFSRGQERPDPTTFFEPVARALHESGQILVFGSGTGMGSEMSQFMGWVKIHHPDVARRVVGAMVVDEHHLTDGQLLAKARACYVDAARSAGADGHRRDKIAPQVS